MNRPRGLFFWLGAFVFLLTAGPVLTGQGDPGRFRIPEISVPNREIRYLPGNVGYLKLDAFGGQNTIHWCSADFIEDLRNTIR